MKRKINLACFILLAAFIVWSFLPVSISNTFFKNSGFGATSGVSVLEPLSYLSDLWGLVLIVLAVVGIVGHLMQFTGKESKTLNYLLYAPLVEAVLFFAYSIYEVAFVQSSEIYEALGTGESYWELGFGWGYYIAAGLLVVTAVLSLLVALGKIKDTPRPTPNRSASIPNELNKYKALLDSGAITQEEFEAKKKQLLNL